MGDVTFEELKVRREEDYLANERDLIARGILRDPRKPCPRWDAQGPEIYDPHKGVREFDLFMARLKREHKKHYATSPTA